MKLSTEQIKEFASYLCREEKSTATQEKYLRDVQAFSVYADGNEITKELVVAWKKQLVEDGYAVRSINSMLASINSLLDFLGLSNCKAKNIRIQRQTYCAEDKELTKAEYLRLLAASKKNEQLNLVLQTICGTGIRVSELRHFTVEAIRQGEVTVDCKSKTRTILVPGKLKNILLNYAKRRGITSGAIFVTRTGKPLNRSNIWSAMKKLCTAAGVKPSKVFPHIIEEYNGEDTCVVIPEYWNVGNGDVVKVTGIAESAFKGNENICAVVLSDFITEIPDYAFQDCTSLKEIIGGNITKIGSYAFDSCTAAEDLGVRSSIEYLGEKAFGGVQRIIVNAADKDVLKAAIESGAEQIIVSLEYLENAEQVLKGVEITVPSGTKFFELNGNYKTYEDFSIVSDADITVLNKIHFVGTSRIPVVINSAEVILNQSTITASGIGLVLCADVTHLGLQGNITVQSDNENAVLAKGLSLYEINKNVVGKLIVKNKLLQCGTTEGSSYLSYVEYEEIDLTTFENLLNSFTLYFDANGGFCDEELRSVPNSTKLGTLPVPTRDHYIFDGWFLADGTVVTEGSVFSTGADVYVYAKWTAAPYTLSWDTGTGYTITVNRTSSPNKGAATGTLTSGTAVYYGDVLSVTYTATTGYTINTKGSTAITVTGDVAGSDIYATASVNEYTVSWNTGSNYTITVKRTSSPLKGAATGTLSNGAKIYHGDVLTITYTASTGYSIATKGITSATVTRSLTSSDIYCTVTANSYTYDIVYKSSNGTALGSTTATYKYGTTNTISAPAKSGYNTPSSQSVKWDSTSAKTITFTYTPSAVSNSAASGTLSSSSPMITYTVTAEYRNRTATSVEVRFTTTVKMQSGWTGFQYGVAYRANCGSASTGTVTAAGFNTLSGSGASQTATSGWVTVSLSTTNATSVSFSAYMYETNYYGTDMGVSTSPTWTVNIPAY